MLIKLWNLWRAICKRYSIWLSNWRSINN